MSAARMTDPRFAFSRRARTAPGSPPGEMVIDPKAAKPRLSSFRIGPDGVTEQDGIAPEAEGILWLNVDGLGDAEVLTQIADRFGLHILAMEDVVDTAQRPKVEAYDSHLFVVLRMPGAVNGKFCTEQVALFLGRDFVITLQERPGDVFDAVRARLRNPHSQIRTRGADYLAYALIDAATDAFFPVLDGLGAQLETLEAAIFEGSTPDQVRVIHGLKHDLMAVRSAVWPLRDLVASLLRDDGPLVSAQTRIYLRDCHDHTYQLIDTVATYREIAAGLVDLHLSSQSNRMNEVMQVLTLIATIFIPLTFVAGVYGMNFDHMPELHWRWGYPVAVGAMAAIGIGLAIWFRSKGWLGGRR